MLIGPSRGQIHSNRVAADKNYWASSTKRAKVELPAVKSLSETIQPKYFCAIQNLVMQNTKVLFWSLTSN